MNRFLKFCLVLAVMAVMVLSSKTSFAGEIDILVQKLVEKGVLSNGEAQEIITETREEVRKEIAKGTYSSLPGWIQNIKLKGDLRVRYQWEDKTGDEDRHRGRYRFRLGLESKVNDKLTVSAGLATGGADSRSTNQTMENSFSTPDIRLDYAFAEWAATPWMTLKAGKISSIKKVIFRPSDLMWDSDINPEGLSVQLEKDFGSGFTGFLNTGLWVLDESGSDTSDPYMSVIQPGFQYKWDNCKLKMGVATYYFDNIKGATLDNGGGTSGDYNTIEGTGLKYDYNVISPGIEFSVKEPFGGTFMSSMKLFGDFVHNPDPSSDNEGWLAGVKVKFGGPLKIFDKEWELGYMYRYLEQDAWLDIFPDSDAYSGHTDVKGHEITFSYPLGKNTELGLDYYQMERIKGDGRRHVLQVDWLLKF